MSNIDKELEKAKKVLYDKTVDAFYAKVVDHPLIMSVNHYDLPGVPAIVIRLNPDLTWEFV